MAAFAYVSQNSNGTSTVVVPGWHNPFVQVIQKVMTKHRLSSLANLQKSLAETVAREINESIQNGPKNKQRVEKEPKNTRIRISLLNWWYGRRSLVFPKEEK